MSKLFIRNATVANRRFFGDAKAFVRAAQIGKQIELANAKATAVAAAGKTKPQLSPFSQYRHIMNKLRSHDREVDMIRLQLADIQASLNRLNAMPRH